MYTKKKQTKLLLSETGSARGHLGSLECRAWASRMRYTSGDVGTNGQE